MKNTIIGVLAMALLSAGMMFAVDGVVLINQSTVTAAGGFPYVISQPGSYKLSGNLIGLAGISAIVISVSNVTLDLNGFNISCSVNPPSQVNCINTTASANNTNIRNGSITGVLLSGTANGGINFNGIFLAGSRNVVEDLRIEVPSTSFPQFAICRTISAAGSALLRKNTLHGSGFTTCPSILVENIHEGESHIFGGSGCNGYGNIGFSALP